MSNGKNPLMLMMALAMPGAASALGLGEIHVQSGLNERLAAEIDIVGATAEDLMDLRAAVANRETFLRYGAERPAFVASATFKVDKDSQGHPVLAVSSTDSFSEPLVNFLVDLRWHKGEVVREYTLLLDPPGFGSATRLAQAGAMGAALPPAAAAAADTAPAAVSRTQSTAPRSETQQSRARAAGEIRVGAKATLRGIAWRVGARSEADLKRMMIAIFRANPSAFDGNINRLYLGAVLSIPSDAALAAISDAEATREFHAQMAAWHAPVKKFAATNSVVTAPFVNAPVPQLAAPEAGAVAAVAAGSPAAGSPAAGSQTAASGVAAGAAAATASAAPDAEALDSEALSRKVQALEKELADVNGQIDSDQDKLVVLRQRAARAEEPAVAGASQPGSDAQHAPLVPIVAGLGLLAALAGLYWRIRRRAWKVEETHLEIPSYREVVIPMRTNESVDDSPGMTVVHSAYEAPGAAQAEAAHAAAAAQTEAAEARAHAADETVVAKHITDTQAVAGAARASAADTRALPSFSEVNTADTEVLPLSGPVEATQPIRAITPPAAAAKRVNPAASISRPEPEETTIMLRMDATRADAPRIESTRIEPPRLDYNLLDLDMTAAQHVQMPSELHEPVMKERRRNLADVLKLAIEREPDRHDLRMKLLEFYYSAAATNRQGFLEVVQQFARDRALLEPEVWEKIAFMGRQIASDNPLFAETPPAAEDDLANCA